MNAKDILEHAGVKGMKWGQRKQAKPGGVRQRLADAKQRGIDSKKLATESKAREKSWKKEYQARGRMTDDQLRQKLNRLRMENELNKLATQATASERKKTKAYIDAIGSVQVDDGNGGKTALKNMVVGAVAKKALAGAMAGPAGAAIA